MSSPLVSIASGQLKVTVNPQVGGTITSVVHVTTGLSVLGEVPWTAAETPIANFAARDETQWLSRYSGGWPLLFPNGGDACTVEGLFHGFHGEASISPWTYRASPASLSLQRRFFTVPAEMERELSVEGEWLVIREWVRMTGERPVEVMWGHHPTFGSDLLAGPVEITSGGRKVTVDDGFDPAANPLQPGAKGDWPVVAGKRKPFDLRYPSGRISALAYVSDFDRAWIAMRRLDNAIAISLSWDAGCFPCAWLWFELAGTAEAPWFGRGNLIGLEPNTTAPAVGLAKAKARGGNLLRLQPGERLETTLRLRVFKPNGPILEPPAEGTGN